MRRRNRQTYMMAARYAASAIVTAGAATIAFDWLDFGIQGVMVFAPMVGMFAATFADNTDGRQPAPFPLTEDEHDGVSEWLNPLWLAVFVCIGIDPEIAVTAFFAVAGVNLELMWTYRRNRKATGLDEAQPIAPRTEPAHRA